jgi:hypothetical protein
MSCQICGAKGDLFLEVTGEPACSICTVKYVGGGMQTPERITQVRQALNLKPGEYLQQDNYQEARRILRRQP